MVLDLPDVPRWVEAHGIAADDTHWKRRLGDGYALGHDAAHLVVVVGAADPAALAELPSSHGVLVEIERKDLARALARPITRAILHVLDDDPPQYEGATVLPDDAPLPEELADELAWARTRGPIHAAYVDGAPAAFAYAPWRSTRYFDVSVDVVPAARQLGLGTIVASAMIAHERASGRQPVWGADENNVASLRLAKRLGFTAVDEVWVAPPR